LFTSNELIKNLLDDEIIEILMKILKSINELPYEFKINKVDNPE